MERSGEKLLNFLQQARQMRFEGLIITPDEWNDELLDTIHKLSIPVVALRRRPRRAAVSLMWITTTTKAPWR